MREYAKVAPTFWTGKTGKAIRGHGQEAVIVALYLMTSPMSNMLGLYVQPFLYMAHDTGLGTEGASKGLRACELTGFCRYDPETETVWVVEMAGWQIAKKLKASDNRCLGVQRDYSGLPDNPFLGEFFAHYRDAFHLSEARGFGPPSMPLPSKEQEQEQEQEQDKSLSSPGGDLLGDQPVKSTSKAKVAERLRVVTEQAVAAYNASKLVKPNGGALSTVVPSVGKEKRQKQVGRCLKVAAEICQAQNGSPHITPEFWDDYFDAISKDDFRSGRTKPGNGHSNWRPDFEYLTKEETMLKVFEAVSA